MCHASALFRGKIDIVWIFKIKLNRKKDFKREGLRNAITLLPIYFWTSNSFQRYPNKLFMYVSLCADIDNSDSFCDLFNVIGDTTSDRHKLFSSPELKAQMTFSDRLSSVCLSVNFSHFNLLLQYHWANINQTWHKDPWEEGIQVYANKGPRPFAKGR